MDPQTKLRVLIAEGTPLTRFAIATLTNMNPRLCVCAQAKDAPEARRLCEEQKPDVVVLDLGLPHGDGSGLIREMRRLHASVRTLVISDREDELTVRRVFSAGALGFFAKGGPELELTMALASVAAGERFVSRRIEQLLVEGLWKNRHPGFDSRINRLSDRELRVFELLGRKLGPTAIARELGVCVKTIETHQKRIKQKLNLDSSVELNRVADRYNAESPAFIAHRSSSPQSKRT